MLLAEVVATSDRVASTASRSAKVAAITELLNRLAPHEVEASVAALAGAPRQGKVGVGWAALMAVDQPGAAAATLTVADLDGAISTLMAIGGSGSGLERARVLADVFARATPDEAFFIRRLLLGQLRQGALEAVVGDAVARAAGVRPASVRRATMLAGDLPKVATVALSGGEAALAGIRLEVLRAVQPMLAASAVNVVVALAATGLSSVEFKLDGARIQGHKRGDTVKLFTRNLNDVTARLPALAQAVRSLPADTLIVDGEVLGVGDDQRPDRFADTMSRFGRGDGPGHDLGVGGLGVRWFDCLHVDGADVIDRPLTERRAALERLAGPWCVPAILTEDPVVAQGFLDDALAAGHEGVMVKSAGSHYEAGRRGQAWKKVKPVLTLDLVVLAAEWGHGRRRGWLSNLHLGARHPDRGFVMVGKTFKGMTDEMLAWQTGRLSQLEQRRHGIVVEVAPDLVVEIGVDGVQASTRYPGGVALRFARVRRYRPDKAPAEADTIDAVRAMLLPFGPS